jgi:hypothetical protein
LASGARFAAETMAKAQNALFANRSHGYNRREETLCLLRFVAMRNKFGTL